MLKASWITINKYQLDNKKKCTNTHQIIDKLKNVEQLLVFKFNRIFL